MKAKWEQHKQQAFSLGDAEGGDVGDAEMAEGMGDGNWLAKYQPSTAFTEGNLHGLGGSPPTKPARAGGPGYARSDDDEELEHKPFDPVRDHTLQQQALKEKLERRQQRRKERLHEQRKAVGEDARMDDEDGIYSASGSGPEEEEHEEGATTDGRGASKKDVDSEGSSDDDKSAAVHVDPTALGTVLFKEPTEAPDDEEDDDDVPHRSRGTGASLGRVLGNREW